MSTDTRAMAEAIAGMLRSSGVSLDELAQVVDDGTTPETTMVFAELVDRTLRPLKHNSRRTYRTPLERACRGVTRICDCRCDHCTSDPEGPCGCPPSCRGCEETAITVGPLADVPVTRAAMASAVFRDLCTAARRIAVRRAVQQNKIRVRAGLEPKPDHGTGAAETAVRAYKKAMDAAIDLDLLATNPVDRVKAPKRKETTKRGIREHEISELFDAVVAGGDDIDLDLLLTWFHLETGARRSGAVDLRLVDLHDNDQSIRLVEKFDKERMQPVTCDLLRALRAHAKARGGPAADPASPAYSPSVPVLYYRPALDGTPHPLTERRYDTLFKRLQQTLSFANEIRLTAHGLRKGAGTIIERIAGTQVARLFLGHASRSDADMYTEAWIGELAGAVSVWTGEDHPLAHLNE